MQVTLVYSYFCPSTEPGSPTQPALHRYMRIVNQYHLVAGFLFLDFSVGSTSIHSISSSWDNEYAATFGRLKQHFRKKSTIPAHNSHFPSCPVDFTPVRRLRGVFIFWWILHNRLLSQMELRRRLTSQYRKISLKSIRSVFGIINRNYQEVHFGTKKAKKKKWFPRWFVDKFSLERKWSELSHPSNTSMWACILRFLLILDEVIISAHISSVSFCSISHSECRPTEDSSIKDENGSSHLTIGDIADLERL